MKDLRVVFMGTPEFSVPVLRMLIENTNVLAIVTQPDKEVGRKKVLTPSPVKVIALEHDIPVLTPRKLRQEYQAVLEYNPDVIITCAYGQIVPAEVLEYPRLGCINVHASLLPKYRGASPINGVLKDGETTTGITIMYMDESIDTGNIISTSSINIEDNDTFGTLSDKLSELGATLLKTTLPSIKDGANASIPQDDNLANYVGLIKRSDEKLNFHKTRLEVYNHIRSLNPTPYAYTTIDGEEWKIISSAIGEEKEGEVGVITSVGKDYFAIMCSDGEILIKEIKPFGKKVMKTSDFFNGYKKEQLLGKKVGEEDV